VLTLLMLAGLPLTLPPTYSVLPNDIRLTQGRADAETTAVVACDARSPKLFIATGTHQSLLRWDITESGIDPKATDLTPRLHFVDKGYDEAGTDNQIVRLKNGDLLLLRSSSTTAPLHPKPEWWDYNGGRRGALLLWRSQDSGKTWTPSKIDAQKILGGKSAWPQEIKDKEGKITKWFGGFDRPDMYADPFNGNLYITVSIDAGSAPQWVDKHAYFHMILLVSLDGGRTWGPKPIVWEGKYDSSYRPLAMTSTPSGRLFLVHATLPYDEKTGFRPAVYWVDPPWREISGSVDAWYGETGARGCAAVDPAKAGLPIRQPGVLAPALSRVRASGPDDVVRLTYMALDEQGRQVQRVVLVRVTRDGKATATPQRTFVAEDPKGSLLQAAFVEGERADDDTTLLYWMETAPGTGRMFARGAVVRGEADWTEPFDLSLKDGQRRQWTPHGEWLGDYIKGAAFYRDGAVHLVAQWPASEPPDEPLYANVVSVPLK
jgi:hypothetical protein